MSSDVSRRDFLVHAGLAAAVCAMAPPLRAAAPRYKLALGQWSFHRSLQAGKMDNLAFAPMAKRDLGFDGVDYVNSFFKTRAGDAAYLADMKKRAADAGVENVLILIDDEGVLGDPDAAVRTKAIDNHKRWVEAAKALGCSGIRVNAHGRGTPDEQQRYTAEGVRPLCEFAATHAIDILIENHGGISSNGAWLAALVKRIDHPRCASLADFGNWELGNGQWYDRYKGVAELVPMAKAISVKAHSFDAQGNETRTDFAKMFKIVVDGGYRGPYLEIEYEGDGLSEADGVRKAKALVERTLAAL